MGGQRNNIKHAYYSRWAEITLEWLRVREMTNSALGAKIGMTDFGVHSFLTGRTKPPLHLLKKIASAIDMPEGAARDEYLLEGQLAHAPQDVRLHVQRQSAKIADLERKLAGATVTLGKR